MFFKSQPLLSDHDDNNALPLSRPWIWAVIWAAGLMSLPLVKNSLECSKCFMLRPRVHIASALLYEREELQWDFWMCLWDFYLFDKVSMVSGLFGSITSSLVPVPKTLSRRRRVLVATRTMINKVFWLIDVVHIKVHRVTALTIRSMKFAFLLLLLFWPVHTFL